MSASNAVLSASGAFRSCFSCTTLRIDWPKFVAMTQSWVAPAANSKSDWTKYAPRSAADLIVHKKKVDEVRRWLTQADALLQLGLDALGVRKWKGGKEREARARVHGAKIALGERGPVWWADGAPDYTRHLVANTPYADPAMIRG